MKDVEKTTNEIIEFIRSYYEKNELKGAVIGIGGDINSAVVAGLFSEAIGKDNVTGLWIDCHSRIDEYNNAKLISEKFGFSLKAVDMGTTYDDFISEIMDDNIAWELNDVNMNVKPRLEMTTLYYYAAMLSRKKKGKYIIPGTKNKCELYAGCFTKGGENVSDIQVLADLTADEVVSIGKYIGVPGEIIARKLDNELSCRTAEDKVGVTYSDVAMVMAIDSGYEKPNAIPFSKYQKIHRMHAKNSHKFDVATYQKER